MIDFGGKRSLVTGATRGIGYSIAERLATAGSMVTICGRTSRAAEDAAQRLSDATGGDVRGTVCDVSDENAVRDMMGMALDWMGGLDILVNNAGVGPMGPVGELPTEQWRETIGVNLTGAYYCCHYGIPALRAAQGEIVNIASRSSINVHSGGGAYCASKFGLLGLSEVLTIELRPDVRVQCVMPGRVSTDFAGEQPADWHIAPDDVAQCVIDILSIPRRTSVTRVELRPTRPPY